MSLISSVRSIKDGASRAIRYSLESRRASAQADSVFVWIPKSAGTSVYQMLRPFGLIKLKNPADVRSYFRNKGRVTFGHCSIPQLIESGCVSEEFIERAFVFTIVRDPYDRAVSLYNYLIQRLFSKDWKRTPTFLEFLNILGSGLHEKIGLYNRRGLSQCNPQVSWVDRVPVDRIYRFEDLEGFSKEIAEKWHIDVPNLEHRNKSAGVRKNDLTADEIRMINKIYSDDFDRFGYQKL